MVKKQQHARRTGGALHCLSQDLNSQDSHFLLQLVASIKRGMWDSLYDTFQTIGQDGCTPLSSDLSAGFRRIDVEHSSNRIASSIEYHASRHKSTVSVAEVLEKNDAHWGLVFAPSLWPLVDCLSNEVLAKELLCLVIKDGKIIRIDHSVTVDEFVEAALQGSSCRTAFKLLSLVSSAKQVPLPLLKSHARQALIEVMLKNSLDVIEDESYWDVNLPVLRQQIKLPKETTGKPLGVATSFILYCLGYLPSDFRSFAADILLSEKRSITKDAPTVESKLSKELLNAAVERAGYKPPSPLMTEENEAEGLYAVVMVPTRELSQQIEEEIVMFARYSGSNKVASVVCGQTIEDQGLKIRQGCEVVIGTASRFVDCLERYVVLDYEAVHRMIDIGVFGAMPSSNYMFSAAIPRALLAAGSPKKVGLWGWQLAHEKGECLAGLVSDGAPIIGPPDGNSTKRHVRRHSAKPPHPIQSVEQKSGFAQFSKTGNPFLLKLANDPNSSQSFNKATIFGEANDKHIDSLQNDKLSPRNSDANDMDHKSPASEDENDDLRADFIVEDSQLPSRVSKPSHLRKHSSYSNEVDIGAQAGSSLCLLRYVQMEGAVLSSGIAGLDLRGAGTQDEHYTMDKSKDLKFHALPLASQRVAAVRAQQRNKIGLHGTTTVFVFGHSHIVVSSDGRLLLSATEGEKIVTDEEDKIHQIGFHTLVGYAGEQCMVVLLVNHLNEMAVEYTAKHNRPMPIREIGLAACSLQWLFRGAYTPSEIRQASFEMMIVGFEDGRPVAAKLRKKLNEENISLQLFEDLRYHVLPSFEDYTQELYGVLESMFEFEGNDANQHNWIDQVTWMSRTVIARASERTNSTGGSIKTRYVTRDGRFNYQIEDTTVTQVIEQIQANRGGARRGARGGARRGAT